MFHCCRVDLQAVRDQILRDEVTDDMLEAWSMALDVPLGFVKVSSLRAWPLAAQYE